MSRTSDLTRQELTTIDAGREAARARAQALIDSADPAEDAAVIAAAESDPDALPMTDEELARMRPAHEVVPQIVADQMRNKGGRPKSAAPKQLVTVRLDADVVAFLKAGGAGWQTRMNGILRSAMKRRAS